MKSCLTSFTKKIIFDLSFNEDEYETDKKEVSLSEVEEVRLLGDTTGIGMLLPSIPSFNKLNTKGLNQEQDSSIGIPKICFGVRHD